MIRTTLTMLFALAPLSRTAAPVASAGEAPRAAAQPARLIRAEVRVGNNVVLRGTTSDDGSPDADEVWLAADQIKLLPTEHFAALKVPKEATKHLIVGTPIPSDGVTDHEPAHRDAVFWISAGGKIEGMTLEIERTTTRLGKPAWKIPRHVLTNRFDYRLIARYRARQLKKLDRKK